MTPLRAQRGEQLHKTVPQHWHGLTWLATTPRCCGRRPRKGCPSVSGAPAGGPACAALPLLLPGGPRAGLAPRGGRVLRGGAWRAPGGARTPARGSLGCRSCRGVCVCVCVCVCWGGSTTGHRMPARRNRRCVCGGGRGSEICWPNTEAFMCVYTLSTPGMGLWHHPTPST